MLYGAGAVPMGVACHSTVPLESLSADDNAQATLPAVSDIKVGMCFMAATCNVSEQITCHRYRAAPETQRDGAVVQLPVRNSKKGGYYRGYSSVFNGSFTDTFG